MIQSMLFFLLGVLFAGFLGLAIAPAALRRTSALTKKRMEASMPLTLNEIQAQTDKARAEAALSVRRLEITAKSLKEKSNAQLIELSRDREDLKRLNSEIAEKAKSIETLEAKVADLEALLQERQGQVAHLSGQLGEAEDMIERKNSELEVLASAHEEASLISSGRQIELAGRESEIERQSMEISTLRARARETERGLRDATNANGQQESALKLQIRRAADLEKKIERMLSKLTDREERLERRERELAQLRQSRGSELRANVAELDEGSGDDKGPELKVARLTAERDRLESRLTVLTRENKKLRVRPAPDGNNVADNGNATSLREQIHQLAAEVVILTANLEGPSSPINKSLAVRPTGSATEPGSHTSLADRVRALQAAASSE